ncbi:MAG: hypothetical protein ABW217_12960, partial [Polyangiaceae bacterium]
MSLLVLVAGCVDTKQTNDPVSEGGAAVLNPGTLDPSLPDSTARPVLDCSGYPRVGEEPSIATQPEPVPVADAPLVGSGPYRWSNVTIKGGGFVSGIVFGTAAADSIYARTDVG